MVGASERSGGSVCHLGKFAMLLDHASPAAICPLRLSGWLVLLMSLGACHAKPPTAGNPNATAPFAVEHLQAASTANERRFDGQVEAVNETQISAQTNGTVAAWLQDVGQRVAAGSVVVRLRSAERRAGALQAEAALREASAAAVEAANRFGRITEMHARQVVPKATLDSATAAHEAAQARLAAARAGVDAAREGLAYTQVTAPYSAVITSRQVRLGETVASGTPLFTLLATEALRVSVDLPADAAEAVRSTGHAVLLLPSGPLTLAPSTVFPVLDPASGSRRIRFTLPTNISGPLTGPLTGLLPGAHITVGVPGAATTQLSVPLSAIIERDEITAVYVWEPQQGRTRLRQVRLGVLRGERREVLAGVSVGDQIAVDTALALQQVRLEQAQAPAGTAP